MDGPVEKVAERDIPVRKVVVRASEGSYRSLYRHVGYDRNVMYNLREPLCVVLYSGSTHYINEGFHSYGERVDILVSPVMCNCGQKGMKFAAEYKGFILDCGVFTLSEINDGTLEIIDCIIPEGSRYYVNERNEYVSDSILIVGKSILYYKPKEGTCAW